MKIHFIAIGGSAMHNLAIALKLKNYEISGSDDEIFDPAKSRLKKYGILPEKIGWYPEKITQDIDAIVLGMHAREDNPELVKAREMGIRIYSFPEFLYEQSKDKKRVVIGGSHGKTTITSMILHVLNKLEKDFDFMVGAQLDGFEVMVKLSETAPIIILEGDEYLTSPLDKRPKFWVYKPDIGVISGIAWDHFNVFQTFEIYKNQFLEFANLIPENGRLIYCHEDANVVEVAKKFTCKNKTSYGIPKFEINNGKSQILHSGERFPISVFGKHNLMNIEAARCVCNELGISDIEFYNAISSFEGASKRLEKLVHNDDFVAYKDFAHSPSKVEATIKAVKEQYPQNKVVAVLELHTYSSLNINFLDQYQSTMDLADLPIVYFDNYALEIKKLPPLNIEMIKEKFNNEKIIVVNDKDSLKEVLLEQTYKNSSLIFMSSGNFGGLDLEGFVNEVVKEKS